MNSLWSKITISKRCGWLGSWIPLRPKVGIFLPIFSRLHLLCHFGHPSTATYLGFRGSGLPRVSNDRWQAMTGVGFWIPTSWKHITSYWSATGYYSTRISKNLFRICIEFILSPDFFSFSSKKQKKWVFSLQPKIHIISFFHRKKSREETKHGIPLKSLLINPRNQRNIFLDFWTSKLPPQVQHTTVSPKPPSPFGTCLHGRMALHGVDHLRLDPLQNGMRFLSALGPQQTIKNERF